MSYKYGDYSGERNDRFFVDMTEASVNEIFKEFTKLTKIREETGTMMVKRRETTIVRIFDKKLKKCANI